MQEFAVKSCSTMCKNLARENILARFLIVKSCKSCKKAAKLRARLQDDLQDYLYLARRIVSRSCSFLQDIFSWVVSGSMKDNSDEISDEIHVKDKIQENL